MAQRYGRNSCFFFPADAASYDRWEQNLYMLLSRALVRLVMLKHGLPIFTYLPDSTLPWRRDAKYHFFDFSEHSMPGPISDRHWIGISSLHEIWQWEGGKEESSKVHHSTRCWFSIKLGGYSSKGLLCEQRLTRCRKLSQILSTREYTSLRNWSECPEIVSRYRSGSAAFGSSKTVYGNMKLNAAWCVRWFVFSAA